MPMVVLGIDAHKRTHTVVAVDEVGRQLGVRVTKTTSTAARLDLVAWADRFGLQRSHGVGTAVKHCAPRHSHATAPAASTHEQTRKRVLVLSR
jgi:hypothetical protein